jgi:hypothetical protein
MIYILSQISFRADKTNHRYYFKREDFNNGFLAPQAFLEICNYVEKTLGLEISTTETHPKNEKQIMAILENYKGQAINFSYGFCTDFETPPFTGWESSPVVESDPKDDLDHDSLQQLTTEKE